MEGLSEMDNLMIIDKSLYWMFVLTQMGQFIGCYIFTKAKSPLFKAVGLQMALNPLLVLGYVFIDKLIS